MSNGKGISICTLITYKGQTKQVKEWAAEVGISPSCLRDRLKKHHEGKIALIDDCFLPPLNKRNAGLVPSNQGTGLGKRARALKALFDAADVEIVPYIASELRTFRESGGEVVGPCMQFYLKYQAFFPKEKLEALDGEAAKEMAKVAIVFNNAPPTDFTIIEQ